MLQKLTDLWPGFLGDSQAESENEEGRILNGRNAERDDEQILAVDEQQLLEDYQNLYWSRLHAVQEFRHDVWCKFPLGADVVEECQAVAALPLDESENWRPLFDPTAFNEAHKPLHINSYRLTPE